MPTIPAQVHIDEGLEKYINDIKQETGSKILIPYRDWESIRKTQTEYKIPLGACLYRLDNGRIKTKTLSHEKNEGKFINLNSKEVQEKIEEFLESSDPRQNEVLKKRLYKDGQKETAVITADGFLINGNRRKLALQRLFEKTGDEKFNYLNVVILPGSSSPERPTITDIALLETRYQFQEQGKSEYTGMDQALMMRAHVDSGIQLKTLLRDDPIYGAYSHNLKQK